MTALQIPHEDYQTQPITISCTVDAEGLSFSYGQTPLSQHRDCVEIELPPTGAGAPVELHFSAGQVTASGPGGAWDNPSPSIAAHTFPDPTSDFLTIDVSTTQADETDTKKVYVKTKPHGGLPARRSPGA